MCGRIGDRNMRQIETNGNLVVWQLSRDEALMINHALNETCNGIDIEEFETRLGCSRVELSDLLDQINASLTR